jgi:hypothetical protein|tara:strand:- start:99 stop:464 length:366 start_codon:yes stop_codon:yes gene_type:complete
MKDTANTRTGTITFSTQLLEGWERPEYDDAGIVAVCGLDYSGTTVYFDLWTREPRDCDLDERVGADAEDLYKFGRSYQFKADGTRDYFGNIDQIESFVGCLDEMRTYLANKFSLHGSKASI